jgi:hypothetical protein
MQLKHLRKNLPDASKDCRYKVCKDGNNNDDRYNNCGRHKHREAWCKRAEVSILADDKQAVVGAAGILHEEVACILNHLHGVVVVAADDILILLPEEDGAAAEPDEMVVERDVTAAVPAAMAADLALTNLVAAEAGKVADLGAMSGVVAEDGKAG